MIILNTDGHDLKAIHDDSLFPFPDINNPLYISKKEVISDGKLIAGGLVRLTAEGILFINREASIEQKAFAAKAVIEALKQDVKLRGLDECHVFVQSLKVQKFLNKLGFKECKGGTPLIIHF